MVKDGVDGDHGRRHGRAVQVPLNLSAHTVKANVPVLWWRSVGSTHTAFVMETLIDEAAHAAKMDPVAYRKQLIGEKGTRHIAALDLAVAKSGYGKKKLPKGQAWGVAVHESFNTVIAYVVVASVVEGAPKLHGHGGRALQPGGQSADHRSADAGRRADGAGHDLPGAAITLKDGVVEQQNFSDYTVARMPDMPVIDVHIVPSNDRRPAWANRACRRWRRRLPTRCSR
jgi:isoquinoline 1-oxidoreductase beta subunit